MSLLDKFDFPALRELLGDMGADGWLLYDFHGINPAATRVLGINGMGTRRFFVLLPRDGKPIALAHRIELASFDGFPGEVRPYAAWRELHDKLRAIVAGKTVAMEVSPARRAGRRTSWRVIGARRRRSPASRRKPCAGPAASWHAAPKCVKRRCRPA